MTQTDKDEWSNQGREFPNGWWIAPMLILEMCLVASILLALTQCSGG